MEVAGISKLHGGGWRLEQKTDDPGVLDLYVYGDVEGEVWKGNWWDGDFVDGPNSANAFKDALTNRPEARQINIYINSYGGSVFEGTAIYNQLRRHPAHKTVYVDGFACSIASVIAMAGDEIIMPRNALMMIHNMYMAAVGNAAELRKAADDLDTINTAGRGAYLAKAGDKLNEERLKEMMDAETWLTAQECIDLGLADRLAEEDADMSQAENVLQKATLSLQQRINYNRGLAAQLRELGEPHPSQPSAVPPSPKGEGLPPKDETEEPYGKARDEPQNIMERFTQMFKKG